MVLIRRLTIPTAISLMLLGITPNGSAQTPAEHAALAHGHPIVGGKDIQPTPQVVQERLRHHQLMLQAERDQATGRSHPKHQTSMTQVPAKSMSHGRP